MEIDFHFGVTYVLSRLAGFDLDEAKIIAYSAQYVDDATTDNAVFFNNGAVFKIMCSAHKALDYRNFNNLSDHLVWAPFHFLPGNCLEKAGDGLNEEFFKRVKCIPNSYIAKDMVNECIRRNGDSNSLHRLGVTMHVYADAWAHQGFSGIQHFSNTVQYLKDDDISKYLINKVADFFRDIFDQNLSKLIDSVLPIGHGAVLGYPDKPFLKWKYKDYSGKLIEKDNSIIFLDAAKNMYKVLQRFRKGDPNAEAKELDVKTAELLLSLFRSLSDHDSHVRLKKWFEMIERGSFGFAAEKVNYSNEGKGSWIDEALNGRKMSENTIFEYNENFKKTNWKKFYDALYDHHYYLLRVIFPKYDLLIV